MFDADMIFSPLQLIHFIKQFAGRASCQFLILGANQAGVMQNNGQLFFSLRNL